jgi:hypothetical protein
MGGFYSNNLANFEQELNVLEISWLIFCEAP